MHANDIVARLGQHLLSGRAGSLLATVDASGNVVVANETLAHSLGRPGAELAGVRLLDLLHPDDRSAMAARLRAILGTEPRSASAVDPIEARLRHDGGADLPVRWQLDRFEADGAAPLCLALGTRIGADPAHPGAAQHRSQLLGRFHEVSRLIGHEHDPERLLQATCELLVASDALEACIVVLTDGERVVLTKGAGSPDGLARLRALPASARHHDPETLALALDEGETTHGVLLALWSAGTRTDEVHQLLGELCSDLASALGAMAASRERNQAMLALQKTRDELEALIAASPAAIFSLDPEGRVLTWSPGAERLLGWSASEVIGQPLPIVPSQSQEQFHTLRQRVLRGETFSGIEIDRQRKDGSPISVSLSTAPLRAPDGSVVGIMSVLGDLSDQRRIERSLHDSEVQLHTLLSNLPGMAYRCRNDESWTIMFASDGAIELTGYAPAELIGNARVAYAHLIHPEDRARVWREVQEAIEVQQPFLLEYRIRTAAGVEKWVWEHGRALRGAGGELWLEGLVTDITRGKQSELELIDRIEDLRCLLDTAAILNRDVPRERALGAVAQRIPSAYRRPDHVVARIVVGNQEYTSTGAREDLADDSCRRGPIRVGATEVGRIEVFHMHAPGEGDHASFGDDDQLVVDGIAGQVGGFVERERISAALRESEARMRALYQRLPIPTFVWQRYEGEFVLTDYNEAARVSTNGAIASWMGQRARQAHADRPDILADLERCYAERTSFEREMTYDYRQRRIARQLVVTYGFVAPDMILVHTQDVTAQRQIEEQLRLAQKLEAIGRLAGGIAHDFNNILTVISSCADFAIDAVALDAPVRRDLNEIRIAADRAASLTRQLLAFSRKQILRPAVLDLNDVARAMETMLRRLLGEDVLLEARLAGDLGTVKADRGQLEQVIMNVAVNARDAMPEGGTLVIETANCELDTAFASRHPDCKPGPHVLLAITDDGQGMDAATRARMFEPFFTTKEPGKGTGLGLSTAYGIVAQSGGCVAAQSTPGKGTRIEIYLPRVDGKMSSEAPRAVVARDGHETILLVEDEATVRELVARILQLAGYHVLVAAHGSEALRIAAQHPERIDLLLTDVIMPRLSGRDVAEALTAERPELRVLYMSGYTDEAIVHHGVLAPGTHFLGKPFAREDLLAKVQAVLAAPLTSETPRSS